MPTWLEQTGEAISCEIHPDDFAKSAARLQDFMGVVLEGAGDESDRFYMVTGVEGERAGSNSRLSLTATQMKEVPAPDWYKDWRECYRSIRLTSPLATRVSALR